MNEEPQLIILPNGTKQWRLNGIVHRTDGPAIEWVDGRKYWKINGKQHRTDGPAVEYPDGDAEWWIDDKEYSFLEWKCRRIAFSITFINTSKRKTKPIIYTI